MTKNTGKGGKNRKKGKKGGSGPQVRELIFKDAEQEYAKVTRMLGNSRIECQCFDGSARVGRIRGKFTRRVWIVLGDIVLVSLRDFEPDKCDVILKYTTDEARNLKTYGELPADAEIGGTDEVDDSGIVFDDVPGGDDSDAYSEGEELKT